MTEQLQIAVQLDDVSYKSGKRVVLDCQNADIYANQVTAILVEKGPARVALARLLAGLIEPNAGRIHRLGMPGPLIGAAGGFTVGGSAMRGLRLRADAFNVDFDSYLAELTGFMRAPEKLRGPVGGLDPFDRAVVTFASGLLLPCSHYVVDGQFLPVIGEAAEALRPLVEETRNRAALISIRSENESAFRIKPDRVGLLKRGVLTFSNTVPKPNRKRRVETDPEPELDPDLDDDDDPERRDDFP